MRHHIVSPLELDETCIKNLNKQTIFVFQNMHRYKILVVDRLHGKSLLTSMKFDAIFMWGARVSYERSSNFVIVLDTHVERTPSSSRNGYHIPNRQPKKCS